MRTPLTTLLALGLAAGIAHADTLRVPKDFETIQEAIDAAESGDTVSISSGIYNERLIVPESKSGLSIVGKGKVFVDAQNKHGGLVDPGGPDDGLSIRADGVTVKNLTIRHAPDDGIYAAGSFEGMDPPKLEGLVLDKVTVINCDEDGFDLDADMCEVKGCRLIGNGGGIELRGDMSVITKTTIESCREGISAEGDGIEITSTTVRWIDDESGIQVDGNNALVSKCTVEVVDGDGICIGGSDGTVTGCKIVSTRENGIYLDGDDNTATKNTVSCTTSEGIESYGEGATITSNTITMVVDDSDAVYVESSGALIEKNRLSGISDTPMDLRVSGSTIRSNTVQDFGGETDAGIDVVGSENLVSSNNVKDGDSIGIRIEGSDNTVERNKVSNTTDNGIEIDVNKSVDNVLDRNSVTNCQGDGIENGGVNTVISRNKLKGNLQDLSNRTGEGASLIDDGGNSFQSGGLTEEPVVD